MLDLLAIDVKHKSNSWGVIFEIFWQFQDCDDQSGGHLKKDKIKILCHCVSF